MHGVSCEWTHTDRPCSSEATATVPPARSGGGGVRVGTDGVTVTSLPVLLDAVGERVAPAAVLPLRHPVFSRDRTLPFLFTGARGHRLQPAQRPLGLGICGRAGSCQGLDLASVTAPVRLPRGSAVKPKQPLSFATTRNHLPGSQSPRPTRPPRGTEQTRAYTDTQLHGSCPRGGFHRVPNPAAPLRVSTFTFPLKAS